MTNPQQILSSMVKNERISPKVRSKIRMPTLTTTIQHSFGSFTSSFPIQIPFISFSSLIAVAKIPKTMLKISGDSGYPCLVPDFRGNAFNFSPLRMFGVGLSYMAFIMLRYVPSIPPFWRIFFHYKWMLNFVKGFHCIY